MEVIELNNVVLVGANDLPSNATAAQRAAFRAKLVGTGQALAQDIRAIAAGQKDLRSELQGRTNREGRSGMMVRTFLTALLTGEEPALSAALGKGAKEKEAPGPWSLWQASKQHASAASFLVQFLARNKVALPKDAKETFVVGGESVETVTADHLAAMTAPGGSDTGIGTIIKYARAQLKSAEGRAQQAAQAEDAAIAAFFDAHRAEMLAPGVAATVATIRERVTAEDYKGPSLQDIIEQGASLVEQRANEEREAQEAQDAASAVERVVRMIPGMSGADLDALIVAIENRKAEEAAASLSTDEGHAEQSTERRRRRA